MFGVRYSLELSIKIWNENFKQIQSKQVLIEGCAGNGSFQSYFGHFKAYTRNKNNVSPRIVYSWIIKMCYCCCCCYCCCWFFVSCQRYKVTRFSEIQDIYTVKLDTNDVSKWKYRCRFNLHGQLIGFYCQALNWSTFIHNDNGISFTVLSTRMSVCVCVYMSLI